MRFLIVTPPYTHTSNGIRGLYHLCKTLCEVGVSAEIAMIDSTDPRCQRIRQGRTNETPKEIPVSLAGEFAIRNTSDAVVVYPEVICGNPLNTGRVVRYMGNREGFCNVGGKMNVGPRDFTVVHSRIISDKADFVLFNAEFDSAMNQVGTRPFYLRGADATYVGKGNLYGSTFWYGGTQRIERHIPNTKAGLAATLRQTRRFITWDSLSATNIDAMLCGAMLVYAKTHPWTPEEIDGSELGPIPRVELKSPSEPLPAATEDIWHKHSVMAEAVRQKISDYCSTWKTRVSDFANAVLKHFE